MQTTTTASTKKSAIGARSKGTAPSRPGFKADLLAFSPVLIYFAINLVIIGAHGQFPQNDDWIYSRAVKDFMETGKIQLLGCSPSCMFHIVSGAAACFVTGFSFVTLRLLCIGAGLVGAAAIFATMRELNVRRGLAALAAFSFASSPLVVNLCFSFMTDIPSLSFTALYMLFVVRGFKRSSTLNWTIAALALCGAIGVRQTNAVFLAANLAALVLLGLRGKFSFKFLFLLLVVPILWGIQIEHIMALTNKFPAAYNWYKSEFGAIANGLVKLNPKTWTKVLVQCGRTNMYLAFFAAPVLMLFLPKLLGMIKRNTKAVAVYFTCAAAVIATSIWKLVAVQHNLMPFSQNLWRMPAVGSLAIMGINIANLANKWRRILTWFCAALAFVQIAVILAGTQRAITLAARPIIKRFRRQGTASDASENLDLTDRHARVLSIPFCFAAMGVSLGLVVIQTMVCDIDRYYTMAFPPMLVALAITARWLRSRTLWYLCVPVAAAIAIYSTCAQQDYMGWSRARWNAIAKLEAQGVSYKNIDGGAEYNYTRDPDLSKYLELAHGTYNNTHRGTPPRSEWRWWPINGEKYIISFSPVPGYETVSEESYFSFLVMQKKTVLALKQIEQ